MNGLLKIGRVVLVGALAGLLSGCLLPGFGSKDRNPPSPDGVREGAGYPDYVQVVGMDYVPADFSKMKGKDRLQEEADERAASNPPSLDKVPLQELIDALHNRLSARDPSDTSNARILANLKNIETKLARIEGQLARNDSGAEPGQLSRRTPSSVTPVPLYDDPGLAAAAAPVLPAPGTVSPDVPDVQWLFRKDPGYTVQLVSMHRHDSVVRFLKDHRLSEQDARIFLWVNAEGVGWHFGLFGRFDSDQLARQAVDEQLNGLAGQARIRRLDEIRQMVCRSRKHLEPPSAELESACAGRTESA